MTYKSNLKLILPSIIIFSTSIIYFLFVLCYNYSKEHEVLIWRALSHSSYLISFFAIITFPGFLLHYRYYSLEKNRRIVFNASCFEIIDQTGINKIEYRNIVKIERHSIMWKLKNPWSDYWYIKIFLENGNCSAYNCLASLENSSDAFLKTQNNIIKIDDIFPWY